MKMPTALQAQTVGISVLLVLLIYWIVIFESFIGGAETQGRGQEVSQANGVMTVKTTRGKLETIGDFEEHHREATTRFQTQKDTDLMTYTYTVYYKDSNETNDVFATSTATVSDGFLHITSSAGVVTSINLDIVKQYVRTDTPA